MFQRKSINFDGDKSNCYFDLYNQTNYRDVIMRGTALTVRILPMNLSKCNVFIQTVSKLPIPIVFCIEPRSQLSLLSTDTASCVVIIIYLIGIEEIKYTKSSGYTWFSSIVPIAMRPGHDPADARTMQCLAHRESLNLDQSFPDENGQSILTVHLVNGLMITIVGCSAYCAALFRYRQCASIVINLWLAKFVFRPILLIYSHLYDNCTIT